MMKMLISKFDTVNIEKIEEFESNLQQSTSDSSMLVRMFEYGTQI